SELYIAGQTAGTPSGGTFAAWVWGPGDGEARRVFEWFGGNKIAEYGDTSAHVFPLGQLLAYADGSGIRLRDLSTGIDRLVVPNGAGPCPGAACYGNFQPRWSADGRSLYYLRIFYEGGIWRVIPVEPRDPLEASAISARHAGTVLGWSTTGDETCGNDQPSDSWTAQLRVSNGSPEPLPSAVEETYVAGCAWSPNGDVAAWASIGDRLIPRVRYVAIYDSGTRLVDAVRITTSQAIVGWLPDGSGLVLRTFGEPATFFVLDRAGTLSPLDLEADEILDILPE
ncbi:MAG: hypothetical protein AB7G21_13535, partial [Dehalococcoidia bacterium]